MFLDGPFVRWALVGAGASNRRPVRIEYPMANCRVWSRRETMGVPDRTTFESAYNGEAPWDMGRTQR